MRNLLTPTQQLARALQQYHATQAIIAKRTY